MDTQTTLVGNIDMPVLLFLILGLIIFVKIIGKRARKTIRGKFKKIPYLNTKAEHNFFMQLISRLPSDYYVAPKVRLADVCLPDDPKNIVGFNKIARKHIDFVVVERKTSRVVCAIELDDKSHQRKDSIRRDKEKDYALNSANIPVHRVKAARSYSRSITGIIETFTNGNNGKFRVNKVDNCLRCNSNNVNKVEMSWPNKGKIYYRCGDCSYRTDII